MRRSLPRAKRRVAHLYFSFIIEQEFVTLLLLFLFLHSLDCFGLQSTTKGFYIHLCKPRNDEDSGGLDCPVHFVIARPLVKYSYIFSSQGRSNLKTFTSNLFKTDLASFYRVFDPAVTILINYFHPDHGISLPLYRQ